MLPLSCIHRIIYPFQLVCLTPYPFLSSPLYFYIRYTQFVSMPLYSTVLYSSASHGSRVAPLYSLQLKYNVSIPSHISTLACVFLFLSFADPLTTGLPTAYVGTQPLAPIRPTYHCMPPCGQ